MSKQLNLDDIQAAVDLVEEHGSIGAASKAAGIPRSTLCDRYARRDLLDPESEESKALVAHRQAVASGGVMAGECLDIDENRTKGKLHLFILSADKRIETPEEALKKAQIDMTVWEVDRVQIKSYEQGCKVERSDSNGRKVTVGVAVTPMFGISIWLKKIKPDTQFDAFRMLVDELKTHKPKHPKIVRPRLRGADRNMYEISLADHHFGKLAWKPEVLENYDLDIARERYMGAMNDLLFRVKNYPIDKILMIVGNDHFHVNNADLTTAKGTAQDVDGRWQKVFLTGKLATIDAINLARAVAPVKVMTIPGNHDPEWTYFLGEVLRERFHDCKDVEIDNRPMLRKYEKYGVNLLGFTHGEHGKMADLPLAMAREMKQQWADATYYEVHTGHLHKRKETKFNAGDTWNGVGVRILPSLCGTDSWHHEHGYTGGVKSSDAYLWHVSQGLSGVFVVNAQDENAKGPDAS